MTLEQKTINQEIDICVKNIDDIILEAMIIENSNKKVLVNQVTHLTSLIESIKNCKFISGYYKINKETLFKFEEQQFIKDDIRNKLSIDIAIKINQQIDSIINISFKNSFEIYDYLIENHKLFKLTKKYHDIRFNIINN